MTVPKNQPTPRTLKLAIGVIKGRVEGKEPAVKAAFQTLGMILTAYESGELDWCDERAKVRVVRPRVGDQPGYGGYGGGGLSAMAEREQQYIVTGDDPDVRE